MLSLCACVLYGSGNSQLMPVAFPHTLGASTRLAAEVERRTPHNRDIKFFFPFILEKDPTSDKIQNSLFVGPLAGRNKFL